MTGRWRTERGALISNISSFRVTLGTSTCLEKLLYDKRKVYNNGNLFTPLYCDLYLHRMHINSTKTFTLKEDKLDQRFETFYFHHNFFKCNGAPPCPARYSISYQTAGNGGAPLSIPPRARYGPSIN